MIHPRITFLEDQLEETQDFIDMFSDDDDELLNQKIKSVKPQAIIPRGRENSDEGYVLGLCDELLGEISLRQFTFDFLVGDTGRKLPVDAYYQGLDFVIEYHERQHSESVPFSIIKRQSVEFPEENNGTSMMSEEE